MKINTALILCAGYGKRLSPITLKIPKPLIEINEITLLENTINFLEKLEIKNIKINTYYLHDQIQNFILNYKSNSKIEIFNDGNVILDTGGGILNLIKKSESDNFLVFNPDTIWNKEYIEVIKRMEVFYFEKKINNILLVVNKSKSFDQKLKGDFHLNSQNILSHKDKKFIYTGCQIINKNIFSSTDKKCFSITEIWNHLIKENKLYGFESFSNFTHVTDIDIFNKLLKNQ